MKQRLICSTKRSLIGAISVCQTAGHLNVTRKEFRTDQLLESTLFEPELGWPGLLSHAVSIRRPNAGSFRSRLELLEHRDLRSEIQVLDEVQTLNIRAV